MLKKIGISTLLLLACMTLTLMATSCKITRKTEPTGTSKPTAAATSSEAASGDTVVFKDSFESGSLPGFWHAVSYVTLGDASHQVSVADSALSMAVIDTDRGPILVSDPIELGPGDIISITRKVRMQYANDYFSGAMRITALENGELNLMPGTDRWDSNLGQIVANVDYLHYFYMDDHKAATDGFVLYDVSAGGFSAAKIQTPVFSEWFDETLTYNASTGETSWTFNGDTSTAQGLPLQQPAISVIMHSYGWYDGHSMDIDELEIEVTKGS